MSLKKTFSDYLHVGIDKDFDPDVKRQIFVINLFAFVGFSVTFVLGGNALIKQNYMLAASLFVACIIFYSSHLLLKIKRITKVHKLSSNCLQLCLVVLMLYLVYSGGAGNTGPLWIYLVPPVALFFGGVMRGIINTVGFLLIVCLLMFYPDDGLLQASYTFAFKTRLILSFMTVTFLFSFYEYYRQKSYQEIQQLRDKFERQAHHDPLTTLVNRRGMREKLLYEQGRAKRNKSHMSLLMCDVDHFKKVNDKFGHDAGDLVLKNLSQIFTSSIRQQDIVARWGGEEFLFMLPATTANEAHTLAEKIRKQVESHVFNYQQKEFHLTLCFGVSEVDKNQHIDVAINQADDYLYKAKRNGRNQVMPPWAAEKN
jgi:diguanylate cyclase (GGDEF)-like protein